MRLLSQDNRGKLLLATFLLWLCLLQASLSILCLSTLPLPLSCTGHRHPYAEQRFGFVWQVILTRVQQLRAGHQRGCGAKTTTSGRR